MLLINDSEKQWQSNGQVYEFTLDEASIRVQIFEETGKVDLDLGLCFAWNGVTEQQRKHTDVP